MDTILKRLDDDFSVLLDAWPPEYCDRFALLKARIWPDSDIPAASRLPRFKALTKLYPWLQAQGLIPISDEQIAKALVAHVCLVAHAYASDKNIDGQLHFDELDTHITTRFHDEAIRLLGELRAQGAPAPGLRILFQGIGQRPDNQGEGSNEARMIEAADVSARIGFLTTACLLAYSGTPLDRLYLAASAYRHTVVALQYADDVIDWREDLQLGDHNLLLGFMKDNGFNAYGLDASERSELNVARALLRFRAIEVAACRAQSHLHAAIQIQDTLGCTMLAEKLALVIREIQAMAPKQIRKLENNVIIECLLSPVSLRMERL